MEINFKKNLSCHINKETCDIQKLNIFEKDKLVLLEDPIINISTFKIKKIILKKI